MPEVLQRVLKGLRTAASLWKVQAVFWVLCCLLLALGAHRSLPNRYRLDVTLQADAPTGGSAVTYFSTDGRSFYPENQVTLIQRLEHGKPVFAGTILTRKPVQAIRVDPTNQKGRLVWYSLDLATPAGNTSVAGNQVLTLSPEWDQLEVRDESPGQVVFESLGTDAKVTLRLPPQVVASLDPDRVIQRRWAFVGVALLFVLVLPVLRFKSRLLPLSRRFDRLLGSASQWVSDESTIVFSKGAAAVYLVLALLSAVWVALGLYQSSIGVWDDLYATSPAHRSVSLGYPKEIRSDEWDVLTPWMLSQVQTGMKVDNPSMGAPASTILSGAPVAGPLLLAQPKYWGFAVLDIVHGFSWYWAFKTFGMIAAVFTLLLLLTRGDTVVSLAGAIALFGSSMVQWWFSGFAPEMIIGLSVAVLGAVYLLWSSKAGGMLFGALALGLVVPNLLMHLYPPHLLPLAHLGVFLIAGVLISPGSVQRVGNRLALRSSMAALALGIMGGLVWVWYGETANTVRLMMETVYPGKRAYAGGGLPLAQVFHGVFESWKVEEWPVPFPPTNQTKASRLWVLFPLVLFMVPLRSWFRPENRVRGLLLLYCIWVLCWSSAPLPESVRAGMARLGWSVSDSWESGFGLGVASWLLVAMVVSDRVRRDGVAVRWVQSGLLALAGFAVVLSYGLTLSMTDPEFFVIERILLASGAVAAIAWAVHRGKRWLYLALMVGVAAPTLHVNPVQNGLDQYLRKDIFNGARMVGADGVWAVFGDMRVAQGFKAVGLRVINGTHYAPRMQMLEVLDPSKEAQDIWNRYAHIELESAPAGSAPIFDLMYPDHYQIKLDVCGPELRKLGVTHLAFSYLPSPHEQSCLIPLDIPVNDPSLHYYRVK
ncbi:hypothetical protein [Hydrogenophaga sp.]|uniref:DUF7657 domain-containing protein n=1 Tax=Hydrogenophaga sp. TaxID=1904254 RepID=UPI0035B12811